MSRSKSKPGSARAAGASGPSQRMLRVGELIRHELSALLARGEIHDDVLASAVVTIPEVTMSPDLKLATIYVMPLGGDRIEEVIAALDDNKRFIRSALAKAVNLKYAPEVRFRADKTFDEASRIARLLDSTKSRPSTDDTGSAED